MSVRDVKEWEDAVATFVATFDNDSSIGEGACTVEVQIGWDDEDELWYIQAVDESGCGDQLEDGYTTEEKAREAAEAYALEHDEAMGEDPETYLRNKTEEAIEEGKAKDGTFALISSQDGSRWDSDRYTDRDSAELAAELWYKDMQEENNCNQLLWDLMDCPVVAELVDGEWVTCEDEY